MELRNRLITFLLLSPFPLLASFSDDTAPYRKRQLEIAVGNSLAKSAKYRVPMSSPLATFAMTDFGWEKKGKGYRLRFRLSDELLGYDPKVDFYSTQVTPAGYIEFKGSTVSASCLETGKRVLCLIKYGTGFSVDLPNVETLLRKRYPKEEEMLARLHVAKFFRDDPAGIVELQLE